MKSKKNIPMVSVSIICFNQEKYIGQALDSILMQKVNLDYEIVLTDDCSTDNTPNICKEYKNRFPDKIRLKLRSKNIGGVPNYLANYKLCQGKYVAYLEGDDFWIDPYKLQKQVDFLEKNKDYVICCSHVEKIDEFGEFKGQLLLNMKDTYTFNDLCRGDFISTPTCMVRNKLIDKIPNWLYEFKGCDWTFDLLNAKYGKIKFFNEKLAAYRIHSAGEFNKLPAREQILTVLNMVKKVNKYFDYKYNEDFQQNINGLLDNLNYLHSSKKSSRILRYIKKNPLFLFKKSFYIEIIKRIFKKIYRAVEWELDISKTLGTLHDKVEYLEQEYLNKDKREVELLILDDCYPLDLSGFRFSEFNGYLQEVKNSQVLTTGGILPFFKEKRNIFRIIKDHLIKFPEHSNLIKVYNENMNISAKLATLVFLGNVYNFLPFLERNKIPFVFTLYPGGSFSLNNNDSDYKLKRTLSSPFFKKVIVTQKITYDYLIKNKFCNKKDIEFIYGGVILDNRNDFSLGDKKKFGFEKSTLDICFVSQKYTPTGSDKGYDTFIESAKKLAKKYKNINFHVVGGFSEQEIDVTEIKDRIRFYGVKPFEWFKEFYRDKDIIISPNIPFVLGKGFFDGFPLTCVLDAMMNEVTAFCSDELDSNIYYKDKKDMVFIKPNVQDVIEKIEYYFNNPEKLKEIGINGAKVTSEVYSYEKQINLRIKVYKDIIKEVDKK